MEFRPQNLILRCYAEQDDDSWFSICLDLNLYARADDFCQVKEKLNGMIKDYITEAFGEDDEYIDSLFPRRAPMYFWFKYYGVKSITGCHLAFNVAKRELFRVRLPLIPA